MSAWYHMSAYCSIKASVIRLTEGLAMELAQTNVHVNSMGPGGIHTRMAEEIQDAAAVAVLSELHEICRQVTSGERDSTGIPQIKPTFLEIAPSGIPSNIIPHSKGVKCGLIRSNSPFSYSNHRPAKPKIPKPLVYAQVSPLGTSFATP